MGYADVHGEAQLLPDPVLYQGCGFLRSAEQMTGRSHIHEGLVDAVGLHRIRILPQDVQKGRGAFPVQVVVWRHQQEVRALPPGLQHGLSGPDAVSLRGDGFGQDDAVALCHVSAYRGRDFPQVHAAAPVRRVAAGRHLPVRFRENAVGQTINSLPGEEGCVHIDMKNNIFQTHVHLLDTTL